MTRPFTIRRMLRATVFAALTVSAVSAEAAGARTLTEQEMVDMMVGASIQATRSSDSQPMIKRVREMMAKGTVFTMIDPKDIGDDWKIVVQGGIGGGGAWDYPVEDAKKANLPTIPDGIAHAVKTLQKYDGSPIKAVVRAEAAGANLQAFILASQLGIPVVDTCLSGRARPETQQSIPEIQGIPRTGMSAIVTRWGDTLIIDHLAAPFRREPLLRGLAVASGGFVSSASTPYTGAQIKSSTIHGSVSQAILWGRTVREATEKGRDPIAALTKVANGYKLFQGTVSKSELNSDKGFAFWDVELTGTKQYAGHTYKIYLKNENIVTWLDGKPHAMSPDFISNLDPKTGDAIAGGAELGAYPMGVEVAMVGLPISPLWRTPEGIKAFGPRHFGFDFDYVPIEQVMKGKK